MYDENYLAHHGVKGMKWGVRRYQNEDGSYKDGGKRRHGITDKVRRVMHSPVTQAVVAAGAGIALAIIMAEGARSIGEVAFGGQTSSFNDFASKGNKAREKYEHASQWWSNNKSDDYGRKVADDIFSKVGKTSAKAASKSPSVSEAKKALDEIMRKAAEMERNGGMDIKTKEAVKNARDVYRAAKKAAGK